MSDDSVIQDDFEEAMGIGSKVKVIKGKYKGDTGKDIKITRCKFQIDFGPKEAYLDKISVRVVPSTSKLRQSLLYEHEEKAHFKTKDEERQEPLPINDQETIVVKSKEKAFKKR